MTTNSTPEEAEKKEGTPPTDEWKRDRGGSLSGRAAPGKTGFRPESADIDGDRPSGPDDGSNSNT